MIISSVKSESQEISSWAVATWIWDIKQMASKAAENFLVGNIWLDGFIIKGIVNQMIQLHLYSMGQ
jgi:hypothetical protein